LSLASRLDESLLGLREQGITQRPRIGVVLGSGLGAFGDALDDGFKVPFSKIPHFTPSTVAGHEGNLCFGEVSNVPVLCMQGRVHVYEGQSVEAVVHGVRTMARLGARNVIITNAAGGLEPSWSPGDIMAVTDHINLTGQNPLVGPNDASMGPRFVDLTGAYDAGLLAHLEEASRDASVSLRRGVYAGLLGPSYETPAEVRMLRAFGAHAVGMSTVLEVIALRHLGVRVAALSCITNLAAGISSTSLDHAEVERIARSRQGTLFALLSRWIAKVGASLESSS
jgi:purine-nucleoside phosphorylase